MIRSSTDATGDSLRSQPSLAASIAPVADGENRGSWLDTAIFVCLLAFVAFLVHSKAATQIAYSAALLLTAIKLLRRREKLVVHPLLWLLAAFLLLSAISSSVSFEPALSWARMKSVGLLVIAPLAALGLRSLRQIRTAVAVLLISCLCSVAYVAWLYAYGIGAQVNAVIPGTPLYATGVRAGEVIVAVDGRRTRTPRAVLRAIERVAPNDRVAVQLVQGEWQVPAIVFLTRSGLMNSGIAAPGALSRARPPRARGALGYPVTYAEVMLQVALITLACFLVAAGSRQRGAWALLLIFVLFCAALAATVTRASFVSLLVAGVVAVWIAAPRRWVRTAAIASVILGVLLLSMFVRRERGLGLLARNDAGTQYRVLMWEDGVRLARQHPWFGVGIDTIKARWQELDIRAYQRFTIKSHFHSTPIQIAAERGLPALLTWAALAVVYLRLGFRLWRRSVHESWWIRGITLGIFAAAVGFLCSGFVHYNLGDSEVQMLFWFLMGTTLALDRLLPRQAPVAEIGPR